MSIIWQTQRLAEVPALLAWREATRERLPVVLWLHGYTVDKQTNRAELEFFAQAGFLAVAVDAPGHGERRRADDAADDNLSPQQREQRLCAIVAQSVAETPAIVDALAGSELADVRRLAICGVSMGACSVYGALASEPRLRAAVALLGSPALAGLDGRSPGAAFLAALLSITAACDAVVPPAAARALHAALAAGYRERPQALRYREIPAAGHLLDLPDWQAALCEARDWFRQHAA